MDEAFKKAFVNHFGKDFILYSKKEILENQLFGSGKIHPRFPEFLGDYLAVAIGNKSIFNSQKKCDTFIGAHAGLTEKEMMVPFIAIECR